MSRTIHGVMRSDHVLAFQTTDGELAFTTLHALRDAGYKIRVTRPSAPPQRSPDGPSSRAVATLLGEG
jgi:hypothetical protein